jgi:ribosomal-protein-alanine N-acetyltransferase
MVQIQFTPFPELATARFRLRQLMKDDENEIFALRSDDFINQYLDRPKANTLDDARNFISKITNGIAKNEAIYWVVTPRDEARFLGTICLWKISREEAKAEIGFELLPENHGKGIMQEVIPEVIRFALEEMRLHSIEAELSPRNVKSLKLLEKNGFTIKTEFNNGYPDSVIYALENTGREKDR